jgi:hypothetical protein
MIIELPLQAALRELLNDPLLPLPPEVKHIVARTTFINESNPIFLPTPFRHIEAAAALKCIEGAIANLIGKERFGYEQDVTIDLQHATLFLLMAYISTIDGLGKEDKAVKAKLKGGKHMFVT